MAEQRGWKPGQVSGYKDRSVGSAAAAQKLENEKIQASEVSALLHELGNLITVLQIGAQSLDRSDCDEQSFHRSLVILGEANSQLSGVIENLTRLLDRYER